MQIMDVGGPSERGHYAPLDITSDEVWQALRGRQLLPFFQPKISLRERRVMGAEALMRWSSPAHGMICARSLLPYLSDQVLAEEVSLRIIEMSLTECRRWHDAGLDLQIAINLPAELLCDSGVARYMARQARSHDIDPSRIIVEVPEVAFAASPPDALDRLVEVRVLGFGLSVDDFGTGCCTREQLERIPASEMKVDREVMIAAMLDTAAHERLTEVLGIAHELNLDTVMEGVETQAELNFAMSHNCDYAQGMFIGAPMAGGTFLDWNRRRSRSSDLMMGANA